jgi:threonine dehydrogenase-like Zn-dependent dehydrogenase
VVGSVDLPARWAAAASLGPQRHDIGPSRWRAILSASTRGPVGGAVARKLEQELHSQCETTQFREQGTGAALFGYSKLYGEVTGGQAEYLRVPFGNTLPIKVPEGPPDDRFVYLSDVLPTAWQAVEYAGVQEGTSLAVLGLGPVGDMSCRIAKHRGASTVIGVDLVPERLARARARGVEALDLRQHGSRLVDTIRDLTEGRARMR